MKSGRISIISSRSMNLGVKSLPESFWSPEPEAADLSTSMAKTQKEVGRRLEEYYIYIHIYT